MAANSEVKKAFTKLLSYHSTTDEFIHLDFHCDVSKAGKRQYSNRLTISGSQTVKVSEKLFGAAPSHTMPASGLDTGTEQHTPSAAYEKSTRDQDSVYVMGSQLAMLVKVRTQKNLVTK